MQGGGKVSEGVQACNKGGEHVMVCKGLHKYTKAFESMGEGVRTCKGVQKTCESMQEHMRAYETM